MRVTSLVKDGFGDSWLGFLFLIQIFLARKKEKEERKKKKNI